MSTESALMAMRPLRLVAPLRALTVRQRRQLSLIACLLLVCTLQGYVLFPLHRTTDLPMWDESNYMGWSDSLRGVRGEHPGLVYSPLYSAMYGLLMPLAGRLHVVFAMKYLATIVTSAGLFAVSALMLRSITVAWAMTSLWIVAQANVSMMPMVTVFALGVFCLALLVARTHKLLAILLLVCAFLSRAEYGLVLVPVALAWGAEWAITFRRTGRAAYKPLSKLYLLAVVLTAACLAGLLVAVLVHRGPEVDRAWHAFAQHYALHKVESGHAAGDAWTAYEPIVRADFGPAQTIFAAARENPKAFWSFIARNLSLIPKVLAELTEPAHALVARVALQPFAALLMGLLLLTCALRRRYRDTVLASLCTSFRRLGGAALPLLLSPLTLLPSLLALPAPKYFVGILPLLFWLVGALACALIEGVSQSRWHKLSGAPLAVLALVLTVLWVGPRPYEGPGGRPNLAALKAARVHWPKRKAVLVGSHATFYGNYLSPRRVRAYEALPSASGQKLPKGGIGIDDLLASYRADAVLVNRELTDFGEFRRETLALLQGPDWSAIEIGNGDTIYFRRTP